MPLDKVMPYVGLMPYHAQDAPFFFGRERERAIIIANLMASRLTVLYGPSGAGKTSVLRAGVEHTLRDQAQRNLKEYGEPERVVVVFNNWRDDPIVGLSLTVQQTVEQTLAAMNQANDGWRDPHELVQSLKTWTKRLNGELLIILDQFEEYFLYHAQEDGEGTFAVEFPRAVNSTDLRVNFLVALREDALSKLDRFKGCIPNLFDNYLRIEHLTHEAASDAIQKPLAEYNRRQANAADWVDIEPELVKAVMSQVQAGRVALAREGGGGIADSLRRTDATIETSYLQLVMTRLWEEEMRAGSHALRLATLNRLKGAEFIVRTHLDSVMAGLLPDESEIAADVFRYLVTPSGTKIAYTVKDLVAYTKIPGPQLTSVLEKLSGSRLRILRTVNPPLDQPREARYEIFHDVLAAAILDWCGRYMQEKDRREFEQRLAEEARAEQLRAEEERRQKELESEARVSRRLRRLVVALVVVSLIAVALAVLAVIGWRQTDAARNEAVAARVEAVNARATTEASAKKLSDDMQGLQLVVQMSREQAAFAQATVETSSAQVASLQMTVDAGARLPPTTATAQAAAARATATQAVAAQATAQAAAIQAAAQAAAARATATQAVAAQVALTRGRTADGMTMLSVPDGTFNMGSENGSDDERPPHKVTLDSFWIDRTEVTNAQYARCVTAGACSKPASNGSRTRQSYYDDPEFANYPVIRVNWEDANRYCKWAGGQLPTEAQWEYAARGPQASTYPWGNDPPNDKLLNYNQNVGDTTPVGSYPSGASWSGALDMAGNVSEWVNDWYGPYPNLPQTNPTGPISGTDRVLRGVSWFYPAASVRSSNRINAPPTDRTDDFGFRCAGSPGG